MESSKIIIYQLLPRLFSNRTMTCVRDGRIEENGCGKMNDIDMAVLNQIRRLGISHVWYTGIIRHATTTDYSRYGIPRQHPGIVKGKAGSPYAITDYYDVDPDLAVDVESRMGEWESLVGRTHEAGMKVVMDFVPNHLAREYRSICRPADVKDFGEDDNRDVAFSADNNFYYCEGKTFDPYFDCGGYTETPAKATGNDVFHNRPTRNDWYETVKLNYGVEYLQDGRRVKHFAPIPDTWKKMTAVLLFWASKGVDAFRCDMAEMVPTEFWSYSIGILKRQYPDIQVIGEVYEPSLYHEYIKSGFDYLYDKVGMYDCLRDVVCGQKPASEITKRWQWTDDIQDHMLYFLENHDEQRVASSFFAGNPFKAVPALAVAALFGRNPFMIYFGQEYGEAASEQEGFSGCDGRTTIFDYWKVESIRRGFFSRTELTPDEERLERIYKSILCIASTEKCISVGKNFDLMYVNPHLAGSQFAFLRKADVEMMIVVANFSSDEVSLPVVIPAHAFDYMEIGEGLWNGIKLLEKSETRLCLVRDGSVNVRVFPNDVTIIKILF